MKTNSRPAHLQPYRTRLSALMAAVIFGVKRYASILANILRAFRGDEIMG